MEEPNNEGHKLNDPTSPDIAQPPQLNTVRDISENNALLDHSNSREEIIEVARDAEMLEEEDADVSSEALAEPATSDGHSDMEDNDLSDGARPRGLETDGALPAESQSLRNRHPSLRSPTTSQAKTSIPTAFVKGTSPAFTSAPQEEESAPQEEELLQERRVWREAKDGWFTLELARSDDTYSRSPTTFTNVLLRNFAYAYADRRGMHELRMRDLAAPVVKERDLRIRVGIEELQAFWSDMTSRWRPFFDSVTKLPLASWQQVAPTDLVTDYRWLGLAYEFVDIQLDTLDNLVLVARETERAPQTPNVIVESTGSATLGPQLRGMSETSETRMREYIRGATRKGQTPLRSQAIAEKGAQLKEAGYMTTHDALSSATSYKTNIATLAAVSFFGASVAWSAVFSGTRGDIVVLAWASSLFVCASVAAGATAIILGSETIDLDRDMNARRALRAFVIVSAAFALGGIVLLSVAMCLLDLSDDTQEQETASLGRIIALRASGIFTMITILVEIAIALLLRRALTPGRYKW